MAQTKRIQLDLFAVLPIIDLGHGAQTILDPADYQRLKRFRWFAKESGSTLYAVRKVRRDGRVHLIRMHREIVAAPPDMPVHHINHNSLDNRRTNLYTCTVLEHNRLHSDFP